MIKTLGGKLVRLFAVAISVVVLTGCALMFTACESSFPEISVRISFNGEEYTLNYKLYRDYYRQTVDHYMALIDADFFDNTVIHDYRSDRMVGGGYTYADMEGSDELDDLTQLDYDGATIGADGTIKVITPTVWSDSARESATNRLHGETSKNGFSIKNGTGLTNKLGVLGTYSYVPSTEKQIVTYKQSGTDKYGSSEYYKNSVTSMFYIYTGSTAAADSNFCAFGELTDEESTTALNDLSQAISDYLTDNELDSFTEAKDVTIEDPYVDGGAYEASFSVPIVKVVIEEIRVTKY